MRKSLKSKRIEGFNSTKPLELCTQFSFDKTCLSTPLSISQINLPTILYSENLYLYCCLYFWLKRLFGKGHYVFEFRALFYNDATWLPFSRTTRASQTAITRKKESRYQHILEPTIWYGDFSKLPTALASLGTGAQDRQIIWVCNESIEIEAKKYLFEASSILKLYSIAKVQQPSWLLENKVLWGGYLPSGIRANQLAYLMHLSDEYAAHGSGKIHNETLSCLYGGNLSSETINFLKPLCKGSESWVHFNDIQSESYNSVISSSRLVIIILGVEQLKETDLLGLCDNFYSAILEVISFGGRPVLERTSVQFCQKLLSSGFSLLDLPIIFLEDNKNLPSLDYLQSLPLSKSSLGQLSTAWWLRKTAPFQEISTHLSRQWERSLSFVNDHLKPLLRISSAIGFGTSSAAEYQNICKVQQGSSDNRLQRLSKATPAALAQKIEIVIPRCCESVAGDLLWLDLLLEKVNPSFLAVSVYYKCPHCLTRSLWEKETSSNAPSLRNMSLISDSQGYQTILRQGGRELLDMFGTLPGREYNISSRNLREVSAFEWDHNGKEITAYLTHIVRRYDSLAEFTFYLHSQPAHHLHLPRFTSILRYLISCAGYIPPQIDFLPLNFRWLEGVWAHQPERCMMEMLVSLFSNSSILGDERRLPGSAHDVKAFQKKPMASNVAAQFVATNSATRRRSLTFWQNTLALNNGSNPKRTPHCYLQGGEAGSAMERIWHNFFKDGSSTADPLYMEDYPDCCKRYLPEFLLRAETMPQMQHGVDSEQRVDHRMSKGPKEAGDRMKKALSPKDMQRAASASVVSGRRGANSRIEVRNPK